MLNTKLNNKSLDAVTVSGMTGQLQKQVFSKPLECRLGDQNIVHNFTYMPDYPIPLLDQDLLCKLHALTTLSPQKQQLHVEVLLEHALLLQAHLTCPDSSRGELFPPDISEQVDETVQADGSPGKTAPVQPLTINLKEGA